MATATSALMTSALMSLEEFSRLPDDGKVHELDQGELVEMTCPTGRHSVVTKRIAQALEKAGKDFGLGETFIEAGFLLLEEPPTLRRPDVAFMRTEALSNADLDQWFKGAPEIAVEVVSPSETAGDLNRKIRQYLDCGSRVVLAVYPRSREIHVWRPGQSVPILGEQDSLNLSDLFPGWSISVAALFGA